MNVFCGFYRNVNVTNGLMGTIIKFFRNAPQLFMQEEALLS